MRDTETPKSALKPTSAGQDGIFLERKIYRRRRLIDGAKLLPLLAGLMFLLPALIAGAQSEGGASTATRLVYFFFVWLAMIMAAATVARTLDRSENELAKDGATSATSETGSG